MNKFCRCGSVLHSVRIELGYNKCVQCSEIQQVSYVPIIEHKTGNSIQIVSQELSNLIHKSWRRK